MTSRLSGQTPTKNSQNHQPSNGVPMPTERHIYQNGVNKGLEDAAKVAEKMADMWDAKSGSAYDRRPEYYHARDIAAAIRKLKSDGGDE